MCQTNVYIYRDGKEELYIENVDVIRPGAEGVFLKSLFGEEKLFAGRIREIALMKHKILLEK